MAEMETEQAEQTVERDREAASAREARHAAQQAAEEGEAQAREEAAEAKLARDALALELDEMRRGLSAEQAHKVQSQCSGLGAVRRVWTAAVGIRGAP